MPFPFFEFIFGVAAWFLECALMRRQALTVNQCYEEPPRTFLSKTGDNCSICLFAMEHAADITYLQCGHAFHDACFNNLRRHSRVCPNCRTMIF